MKVLITGATGFVGSKMVPALLDAGHEVQAVVRTGSLNRIPKKLREHERFSHVIGDVTKAATLEAAGEGCEAVIHLVGIIEEDRSGGITFEKLHVTATRNVVNLAKRVGAKRIIHMSALGAREFAGSEYHRTKYRAESYVKMSLLPYVIFRPSVIFGPGDGFVGLQKNFISWYLPAVAPGGGTTLVQPVHIDDVVAAFVAALGVEDLKGKIYELGGPDKVSLAGVINMIAEAKKMTPRFILPVPIWLMKPVAGLMHAIWPGFPVNKEQLTMLQEDNVTEDDRGFKDLGIKPRTFDAKILREYI